MTQNTKQTLIKVGDQIHFGVVGNNLNLTPGQVYIICWDHLTDESYLKEIPSLQLPTRLYIPNSDKKFVKKIISKYNSTDAGNTGVILTGIKGTGKTVLAKKIAIDSGLPIIIFDKKFPPRELPSLMVKLSDHKVCIIIDEIDKYAKQAYHSDDFLLQVFDGISTYGNNIIICTCNDTTDVNEYLLDRCSRIRYYRKFEELSSSMIELILLDRLENTENVKEIVDFIQEKFGLISFDNVASFADEINAFPDESLEELFTDMNISEK